MTEQEYISRPKMLSELLGGFFPQDVVYTEAVAIAKQIIESAPAEDVVPRAVIEEIFGNIYLLANIKFTDGKPIGIAFEEAIEETKKKYTEGEDDNHKT